MSSNVIDPFALIRNMLAPRAFALVGAPPDPELLALLKLGEAAAAEPGLAVALSAITTPRVRTLFQSQETSFPTTSGLRFMVDGSDVFAATLAAGYLPENRDFEAFMHLAGLGSVVVDVGANFGLYALSAAVYARPHGRVFAFEPALKAFALLERNIADNGMGAAVAAKQAAVAAAAGTALFHVGRDVSFSSLHRTSRLADEAETVEVEVVTLDDALASVQSIDLLKIDVEGGEGEVLRGAREVLRRSRAPIVQFEFSYKNMDRARRAALEDAVALLVQDGFHIYRRGATEPVALPNSSEMFSGNLFLARDGAGRRRLLRVLVRTSQKQSHRLDPAALTLLRRVAEQEDVLKHAELLQQQAIEVADSVVGSRPSGSADAVRAIQNAWLEARRQARDAENKVAALSASVEARDLLLEQSSQKLANLREIVVGLEDRAGRLAAERDHLLEKSSNLRGSIDDLHQSMGKIRAEGAAAQERATQKHASLRLVEQELRERLTALETHAERLAEKNASLRMLESALRERIAMLETRAEQLAEKNASLRLLENKLRERVTALEAALKTSGSKVGTARKEYKQLAQRLKASEAKRAHMIKVSKRLQARCEALLAQIAEEEMREYAARDSTSA